jgi:hypothetical protein
MMWVVFEEGWARRLPLGMFGGQWVIDCDRWGAYFLCKMGMHGEKGSKAGWDGKRDIR